MLTFGIAAHRRSLSNRAFSQACHRLTSSVLCPQTLLTDLCPRTLIVSPDADLRDSKALIHSQSSQNGGPLEAIGWFQRRFPSHAVSPSKPAGMTRLFMSFGGSALRATGDLLADLQAKTPYAYEIPKPQRIPPRCSRRAAR